MAGKTYEQKLEFMNNRNSVFISDLVFAICNKYGVDDLRQWVQKENMLEFLKDIDPELTPILTKWLNLKVKHIPHEYREWLNLMDNKKDPQVNMYIKNLIIRFHIMGFITWGDTNLQYVEGVKGESNGN
jgi:hypothetical protein